MRTLNDIRAEIEHLSGRRNELLRALGDRHDPALAADRARIDERSARLW